MIRAKEARQEAREALSGKWKKAFLISLVYMIFTMLIGLVGGLLGPLRILVSIAEIVILPPLTYGMAYSYYHLKNGEEVSYVDFLKSGFDNFGRSWGIAWRIFCKCWYLILIPVIIMAVLIGIGLSIYTATNFSTLSKSPMQEQYLKASYSSTPYTDYYDYYNNYYDYYNYNHDYNYDNDYDYNYKYNNKDSSVSSNEASKALSAIVGASAGIILLAIGLFVIYIVILVLVIRKLLLYALSYYIAVANEGMTPRDAVQESENLMKGNRGRLFCLMLSFFGWAFLVGLVEGVFSIVPTIGWLFGFIASAVGISLLTPYMTFTILAFYEDLKGENNTNSNINNQNGPVIGGYNNQNTNNGYQVNTNPGMNNGYQANTNLVMNNRYQTNTNPGINNGYQVNTNPGMNNGYNVNPNGIENNTTAQINQIGKKYCKRCGAENTLDATYCTNCGAKLD